MPRRKQKPKTIKNRCKSANFYSDNTISSDSRDGHDDEVIVLSPEELELPQRNAANARERARMRVLSKAFCRLKTTLPWVPADTKLSKLDTLRLATSYIAHLRTILTNVPDHYSSHLPSRKDDIENDNKKSTTQFKNLTWPFVVSQHQQLQLQPQPQPFQQQPQTQPERPNFNFNIEPELSLNSSYCSNINTCCLMPNQTIPNYLTKEVADQDEHQDQTIQSLEQYFY